MPSELRARLLSHTVDGRYAGTVAHLAEVVGGILDHLEVRSALAPEQVRTGNVKYRILHFVSNPLAGTRVPVAVLVERPNGVEVLLAPHLPGADYLGVRAANAIRLMCVAIRRIDNFHELPATFGPHFHLAEIAETPPVEDAIAWLRRAIFPEAPREESASDPEISRNETEVLSPLDQAVLFSEQSESSGKIVLRDPVPLTLEECCVLREAAVLLQEEGDSEDSLRCATSLRAILRRRTEGDTSLQRICMHRPVFDHPDGDGDGAPCGHPCPCPEHGDEWADFDPYAYLSADPVEPCGDEHDGMRCDRDCGHAGAHEGYARSGLRLWWSR